MFEISADATVREMLTFILSGLSRYGVPEKPTTELTELCSAHLFITALSFISSLTA